jgi:hypothetical protein
MKILKTLYTATLCAAMAVSTSSCLNSWLDQSPADGIDAETAIKNSDITTNGANVFLHKNLPPFDLLKMIQDGNHPPVASMLGSRAAGYRKSHGRGLCVLPFPWLYYSE